MTTPTARPVLKATGLRKSFGGKTVLDGIDLDIAAGTTFSMLGPNGAGKTTTVQILSTLLSLTPGRSTSPASILPANPTRCAPRSVSPASSRR